MSPKHSKGDLVWVKANSKPFTGEEGEGDYRAEVVREPQYESNHRDWLYYVRFIDFPDMGEWTTFQQLTLPYYVKQYDGRFIAKRDKALRNIDPQTWYTNFNLHNTFVGKKKTEKLKFGDRIYDEPKTFFIRFLDSEQYVEILTIEDEKATLKRLSHYVFKYTFFRNFN